MKSMSYWHQSTDHNVDAAHRAFSMLICARIFVLKCLLESMPPGTSTETARRRWVLIQVMPPSHIKDIFVAVLESLRAANKTDIMDFAKTMLMDTNTRLGQKILLAPELFAVVDEAQAAAEYLNGAFRSTTTVPTEDRPILHPFFSFLWNSEIFSGVILAGTGLSMKMVRTAVASQGGARMEYRQDPFVFVEVGRFMKNGKEHEAYSGQQNRSNV